MSECVDGQHPGGNCFGYPSAPGRIEAPAARRAAEQLPLAAVAARRETSAAPKANAVARLRCHLESRESATSISLLASRMLSLA
jgi:hypothetical protein